MDWLDDSHAGCGWKHVHSRFILQIFRQNSLEWITEDLSRCLWCCSLSWLTGHCRADGSTPLPPPVVRNSGGMWHDLHHYCCLLLCVFVDRCLTRQWSWSESDGLHQRDITWPDEPAGRHVRRCARLLIWEEKRNKTMQACIWGESAALSVMVKESKYTSLWGISGETCLKPCSFDMSHTKRDQQI